jgi:hypothetical protein
MTVELIVGAEFRRAPAFHTLDNDPNSGLDDRRSYALSSDQLKPGTVPFRLN